MTFHQGDIVLVPFPFSNQSGSKPRPAIVISNSKVNKSKDVILAQITSTSRLDDYSYVLENKMLTHDLGEPICEVRCHKLYVTDKLIVVKKISSLKKENHSDLINKVISLIEIE